MKILMELVWGVARAKEFLKIPPGNSNVQPGLQHTVLKSSQALIRLINFIALEKLPDLLLY